MTTNENSAAAAAADHAGDDSIITERARHFGQGDRHGGWLFAADVACCVRPGQGKGRNFEPPTSRTGKVSARTFADRAGTTDTTVMCYLRAWELAHREGLGVPPADSLVPRSDPPLPSTEQWDEIYHRTGGPFDYRLRRREPAPPPAPPPPPPRPPAPPPRGEQPFAGLVAFGEVNNALDGISAHARKIIRLLQEQGELFDEEDREAIIGAVGDIRPSFDAIVALASGGGVSDEALRAFIEGDTP